MYVQFPLGSKFLLLLSFVWRTNEALNSAHRQTHTSLSHRVQLHVRIMRPFDPSQSEPSVGAYPQLPT